MRASEKAAAAYTKKRSGERRSGEEEGWRKSREVVGKLECEERERDETEWEPWRDVLVQERADTAPFFHHLRYLFVTIAATFPVISKTFCFLLSSIHPILISFIGTESVFVSHERNSEAPDKIRACPFDANAF